MDAAAAAGPLWLDFNDCCSISDVGSTSSSTGPVSETPASDSSLSAASMFPCSPLCDAKAFCNPHSPDVLFPGHLPAAESNPGRMRIGAGLDSPPRPLAPLDDTAQLHGQLGSPCHPLHLTWASVASPSIFSSRSPNRRSVSPPRQETATAPSAASHVGQESPSRDGTQHTRPRHASGQAEAAAAVRPESGGQADAGPKAPRAAAGKRSGKAYLHNKVEKNYRDRLNNDFQMLLDALADCEDGTDAAHGGVAVEGSRGRSKGSILRWARWKLKALQADNCSMAEELRALKRSWAQ
ncbi:uncharacterized protein UV8b_03402 [Ustilaginoidea virens]|uniref:BHLH domain-containing protein n=1 Tax=Ustilaginoidea virens TaxID=1159556 RepID=A0A8E5MH06_USTVR|nr:uncharacterized protein UV8b_03402 [Ustilaginoidea virens]QUC19161.1 hypothetical protein UV8b_03402 [Ustilaginoidea virens]